MKRLVLLALLGMSMSLVGQNDRFFNHIEQLVKNQQFEPATDSLLQFIDGHPGRYFDQAKAYFLISRNDLALGDFNAAMANNQKSLELRERLLTDDIAENFMQLGAIYYKQEQYEKALQNLEKARELPLEDPQLLGQIDSYFAMVLEAQGKYTEAINYLEHSLKVLQIELGDFHPDVGATYYQLGKLHKASGQIAATTFLQKAVAVSLLHKDLGLLEVMPNAGMIKLFQRHFLQ